MTTDSPRPPTRRDLRVFAATTLAGSLAVGALLWRLGGSAPEPWAWTGSWRQALGLAAAALGAGVLATTLASDAAGRRVHAAWMAVARAMGAVMTPAWMTLLFVAVLPVFALIRFADPLRRKLDPSRASYFEPHRPHEPTLERLSRPF